MIGGSLGAQALNEVVPQALALLPADARPQVTHQSGAAHAEALRENYRNAGVTAEILPFIDDMAAHYAAADLIICRAGASTVSELAAAGVASVLVPYPHAVDDHQTHNARYLERTRRGGAAPAARAHSSKARAAARRFRARQVAGDGAGGTRGGKTRSHARGG